MLYLSILLDASGDDAVCLSERNFAVIFDLHIHTSWNSADSNLHPVELIREAKRLGLDGVVVTEHDKCWDRFQIRDLAAEHNFLFLRGMEVSTDLGHILVYGLEEYVSGIRQAEKLRRVVNDAGGAMVVAHPFRRAFTADFQSGEKPTPLTLEAAIKRPVFALIDGVEVCNGASADRENRFAIDACEVLRLAPTGGSDAHSDLGIGCYATQFDDPIRTEADVIAALKQGRCHAVVLQKYDMTWRYEPSERVAKFQRHPRGPHA
jgi:predicted metal-dependent phosphoesterase TrpH